MAGFSSLFDMSMVPPDSRVTYWHATLFFQIFDFMIYFALSVWYIFVATAPNLISEYLPPEGPADITTILGSLIIALLFVPLIYFMWKQKRAALVASIGYSAFLFVTVLVGFLFKSLSAPAFSDFLFFPVSVLTIIFGAMAYRALSKKVS